MARTNLIKNPSFELDLTGWTWTGGAAIRNGAHGQMWAGLGYRSGSYMLQATADGTSRYLTVSQVTATDRFTVSPGQWVGVSVLVASDIPAPGGVRADVVCRGTATTYHDSGTFQPSSFYAGRRIVYAFQVPATATTAEVRIQADSGSATFLDNTKRIWADNIIAAVAATQAEALAAVTPYFDGSTTSTPDWTYSWSGTAHASTSLETATPGLRVVPVLGDPCPRVEITVTGLDPVGPSRVTVWRSTVGGKRRAVRGWKNRLVFGSDIEIDYEAPLGREIRYDLQVISGAATPLRVTATCTLAATAGLIQDPLVPGSNVPLVDFSGSGIPTPTLAPSAFRKLTYDMGSSQERVLGSDTPVGFAGQRMVAAGVDFSTLTDSAEQGTALRNLLMTAYPILVRPLPEWGDLPDLLYLDVPQPTEEPLNAHTGGTLTRWTLAGDQVTPPSLSVVVPLWTYDQVQDLFAAYTYAYRESLAVGINATYMDDQRDPTLGG